MKFLGSRTIKTGVGAAIAIIIAQGLGLSYSASAGVITILSIQNTKRLSLALVFERILATIIGLLLSTLLFTFLGHNPIVFGLFLIIFIPIAVKFNLSQGIVVTSVLATHILAEKVVTLSLIINEILLVIIGVTVALILNLYIPKVEDKIKDLRDEVEGLMRDILMKMSIGLENQTVSIEEEKLFTTLKENLRKGKKFAYIDFNNYFISPNTYYIEYMNMRNEQFKVLNRMRQHFRRFFMTYEQTIIISKFTEKVAVSLDENNSVEDLVEELSDMRNIFREMDLPKTREEFENRAMLYQFINDLEEFLDIKYEFYRKTLF